MGRLTGSTKYPEHLGFTIIGGLANDIGVLVPIEGAMLMLLLAIAPRGPPGDEGERKAASLGFA